MKTTTTYTGKPKGGYQPSIGLGTSSRNLS